MFIVEQLGRLLFEDGVIVYPVGYPALEGGKVKDNALRLGVSLKCPCTTSHPMKTSQSDTRQANLKEFPNHNKLYGETGQFDKRVEG